MRNMIGKIMQIKEGVISRGVYVVVQFYPWFNFYFLLLWGMLIYDNEINTKEDKN